MNINSFNSNNLKQNIKFTGLKTPDIDDLIAIKRFTNCGLDNLEIDLLTSIKSKAPKLIKNINGQEYIPEDGIKKRISSSVKSFIAMPLDVIDYFIQKFPNSNLNKKINNNPDNFLNKYRQSQILENEVRALQGLHKNALKFIKEDMPQNTPYPTGDCDDFCKSVCESVTKKFNDKLNNAMADKVANYDTKKERFAARLVSGFTAALFLGNDFYNKSIQKGNTEEQAKSEQHLKQGQEIKENICEGITQFAIFSIFSKTVNKSVWAPAIIGAGIGLVSRVISRLSSGMPIARIKVPEKSQSFHMPLLNNFVEAVKTGNTNQLLNVETDTNKENKKPLLSAKNILLFCAASILGGYSLRFLKGHAQIGKAIAKHIQKHNDKFNAKTIKEVNTTAKELSKLNKVLNNNNEKHLSQYITNKIIKQNRGKKEISLGTDFVTTKLFGIEVKTKDLKRLKTAPFRFIKEIVSYPYKLASKLETAIRKNKPSDPDLIIDTYGIKNIYKKFLEFETKYGDDEIKLTEEFGKYIRKMRLISNNEVTSSKGDNSKIAVIAQTLGTLTGMWFNMNDEFNSSVRSGSTKKEAEKEARLRGLNKFFRMTVQVIISGTLNDIFQKQYNNSIAGSAIVVAISTILTDMASRVLSGMPSKKMTKEELEQYQKTHKEGLMGNYYKMIDKLAS